MTTSGTSAFNMSLNDIFEESYSRAGQEMRTGWDFRTARTSLNLLTIEWASRGINLWTIEQGSIAMVDGTISYNLPVDTIDLLEQVIRTGTGTNQSDINISRISVSTYSTIPNKNATGRPIQVWINRQSGATEPSTGIDYPTVNVWPAPDQSNYYTFVYWRLRRIQDAGTGVNTMDMPFRFYEAMTAGLAYHLALKIPGAMERLPVLKQQYDEAWELTSTEDREKAAVRFVPRPMFIGTGGGY